MRFDYLFFLTYAFVSWSLKFDEPIAAKAKSCVHCAMLLTQFGCEGSGLKQRGEPDWFTRRSSEQPSQLQLSRRSRRSSNTKMLELFARVELRPHSRVFKLAQTYSNLTFSSAVLRAKIESNCSYKPHISSVDMDCKTLFFLKQYLGTALWFEKPALIFSLCYEVKVTFASSLRPQ
jgi:hypothetical protein